MERISGRAGIAASMLKGLVIAALFTVAALLILAFISLKLEPDARKMEIGILITYVAACFAGGWYCGHKAGRRKFLWGLLLGALYFLLLFAVSGMGERDLQSDLLQSLTSLLACAAGGMLGGIVAS